MKKNIKFNDLSRSFKIIKIEYYKKLALLHKSSEYINGQEVKEFEEKLKKYLSVKNVITCANGTDALMMSIFSLNLKKNDEVIMPAFSYISVIEVVTFLGLKPVLVDVEPLTFNINVKEIKKALTSKTKLIIPVHLFGNNSNMNLIMQIAKQNNLFVIEDAAQSIGSKFNFKNKLTHSGTIGDIGCASFFPTKNLGCFGDGGVIFTNNNKIAKRLTMIRNHGQKRKYIHEFLGFNSRLDSIQASVLNIKLKYLDKENKSRQKIATEYNNSFKKIMAITIPNNTINSNHIYHQYTIRVSGGLRDSLKLFLHKRGIPSVIYYPFPINYHKPFKKNITKIGGLFQSMKASKEVLSLPIYPYLTKNEISSIINSVECFFDGR